jgi:hypothetical protein
LLVLLAHVPLRRINTIANRTNTSRRDVTTTSDAARTARNGVCTCTTAANGWDAHRHSIDIDSANTTADAAAADATNATATDTDTDTAATATCTAADECANVSGCHHRVLRRHNLFCRVRVRVRVVPEVTVPTAAAVQCNVVLRVKLHIDREI